MFLPTRPDSLLVDTYWEGAGPTDVADRVHTSMPILMVKELHKRLTAEIAEADKCGRPPFFVDGAMLMMS